MAREEQAGLCDERVEVGFHSGECRGGGLGRGGVDGDLLGEVHGGLCVWDGFDLRGELVEACVDC